MKSKISLVILTPGFAADENDSTAFTYLQLYLEKLHSVYPEIQIHIVSFHYPLTAGKYVWKGLSVYAVGGTLRTSMKIFLWIRILSYLLKLKKEIDIDLIHTFWLSETTLIGLLFRQLTGIPVIATAMGQDIKKQNKYLWLIRFFKFDLITLSDFQENFLKGILRNNLLKVIPFGIDLTYFRRKKVERTIDILAVGSLNQIKNYGHFIEIVRSLVNVYPCLNCAIIGEGTERVQIEKLILDYRLENQIKLFGLLTYEKVIGKMEESRILLHSSVFEGQGLIITEALAAGAYVVSYPVGIAWNLENRKLRTGKTREALEQHIISLLSEKNPDFSPEIIIETDETCREYNKIYHTLVSAK